MYLLKKCSRTSSLKSVMKRLKTSQKSRRNFADHLHRSHRQPLNRVSRVVGAFPMKVFPVCVCLGARCPRRKLAAVCVNINTQEYSCGTEGGGSSPARAAYHFLLTTLTHFSPFVSLLISLICFAWTSQQGTSNDWHVLFRPVKVEVVDLQLRGSHRKAITW